MKPSAFAYSAPRSLAEALSVLAEAGADGKVLAGGQSLVPILNMRLAAPAHIIDINRIPDLAFVRVEDGGVRIGALARHADVEHDESAFDALPLLRQALRLVAHPVIRNRGTTVGSLAHADPSGEMTAVLALTGGAVEVARQGSTRTVGAAEFFVGPLESAVEPGELAVSAHFPTPPPSTGTTFVEVARRHGDYAVCGRRCDGDAAGGRHDRVGARGVHLGRPDPGRAGPHRGGRVARRWRTRTGRLQAGSRRTRWTPSPTSTRVPTTGATSSGC